MKAFITGGAGFIGSNIAHHFLKKGTKTVVYDNLSRKGVKKNLEWLKSSHPNIIFHKSDIRDFNKLKRVMKGSDIVFHMASQVAVTTSVENPRQDFEINAQGTLNVLEAAKSMKKPPIVIYASTNKVYGSLEGVKVKEKNTRYEFSDKKYKKGIHENFNIDFHSPYGCSKGAGDQYVRDYARIYGLKTIVFRQSCIYGTRQFGNEDQGWVAHFVRKAIEKKTITLYGNGKQVRDLLYVDDLIDCFNKAVSKISKTKGQIYNVGGGIKFSVSLLELLKLLEDKLDIKIKVKFDDWRNGDQKIYISNNSKATREFGWQPQTNLSDGLDKLLEWIKTV